MRFKTILALLLLALLLAGCSAGGKDALPDALLRTSYTYPDEWPENRFTDCIPQPDGCTVESVRDLSSVGRYELNLSDITRDETHAYIRRLESEGYRNLGGDENEHSGRRHAAARHGPAEHKLVGRLARHAHHTGGRDADRLTSSVGNGAAQRIALYAKTIYRPGIREAGRRRGTPSADIRDSRAARRTDPPRSKRGRRSPARRTPLPAPRAFPIFLASAVPQRLTLSALRKSAGIGPKNLRTKG